MNTLTKIVGIIGLIVLIGLALSFPTWLLWNAALVSAIDGVHEITWLQAWGLQILVASLFKTEVKSK